jgi:hypothetical protein
MSKLNHGNGTWELEDAGTCRSLRIFGRQAR